MPVPAVVLDLVERFKRNRESYKSGRYNETQLRREFVDPFFEALGWDVNNKQGFAEAYKDVVHEDSIRVEGGPKSPDYAFRIGGVRKFFVETKKPSVNIKDDPSPAYQLRRYAWSAKLPLSILTDFEEFVVYDTREKPSPTDKASRGRVSYITCDQYAEEWDNLVGIFSPDAIRRGDLDRYAQPTARRKGTAQVDDAFLAEMESWREILAKNIALRNASLDVGELNRAVQMTIDRIVFLRIAEDRGLEEHGQLKDAVDGAGAYKRLLKLFLAADRRYNSGLFHFSTEHGRSSEPDDLTPPLAIDDKPLKAIVSRLYYPESPYEFSVLPADILGQVYERFLGKVIRLTAGHRAVIEPKPEVRKAGGVYYTPTLIVDHIVRRTIGEQLQGRRPAPAARGAKQSASIKVLDPACGSGSFLLGAYQYLLDWHRDWYVQDGPEKWAKAKSATLFQRAPNDWRLTTAERKRILLDCIFGVDIDAQAVEVTKLSLLLKVLEGETQQTMQTQLKLFHERALPDLDNNIRRGNSLIEHDYYNHVQQELLVGELDSGVYAFDWKDEFPSVMAAGGFDAVIGNPPYDVMEKERGAASWPHSALADYVDVRPSYQPALGGKLNLFRFFVVRGLSLTREGGRFGMIVPLALLADISCASTRKHLLRSSDDLIADCFPQKDNVLRRVFRDAKLSTVVLTCRKASAVSERQAQMKVKVYPWNSFADNHKTCSVRLADTALIDPKHTPIPLVNADEWELCRDVHRSQRVRRLGSLPDFSITRGEINQTIYRRYITSDKHDARLLKGVEVAQYHLRSKLSQGEREWFNEGSYLRSNAPKPVVHQRRIATQRITGVDERLRVVAALVEPPTYFADSTNSIALTAGSPYRLEYLLGILNSPFVQWRFKLTSTNNNVGTNELECLPFPTVDFSDATQRAEHDKLVRLVERTMTLHERLSGAKVAAREGLLRQLRATEREINALVYQLYNISEDEISIVERPALDVLGAVG